MPSIVLTRDAAGCARYEGMLAPLAVVSMPVTCTAQPADPAALGRALARGTYAAIVCASARAAEALVLARRGEPWPAVWAVGSATAAVLSAAGMAVVVPPGVADASTLAAALVAHLAHRLARGDAATLAPRVLVPRAQDGRDEGLAILRAGGIEVVDVAVYRTLATAADDPALASGRAARENGAAVACAVFAPSQVAALDALLEAHGGRGIRAIAMPFVAIGDTTAAALRDAGAGAIAVAAVPTPEGLAKAVAAVYPPMR